MNCCGAGVQTGQDSIFETNSALKDPSNINRQENAAESFLDWNMCRGNVRSELVRQGEVRRDALGKGRWVRPQAMTTTPNETRIPQLFPAFQLQYYQYGQ